MNIKELRSLLVAFDDDVELYAAPEIRMEMAGKDVEINVPHPLEQHELTKLHVVGVVDQQTGDVTERRVVLAFDQPEHPPEIISDELRQKFIRFREAYMLAQSKLTEDGADSRMIAVGSWEAARRAEPLTNDELRIYNKFHVAVHNVSKGNLIEKLIPCVGIISALFHAVS